MKVKYYVTGRHRDMDFNEVDVTLPQSYDTYEEALDFIGKSKYYTYVYRIHKEYDPNES